jgi:hypothetical protein
LSRHRKIQLSRAKAILVAAGALSVATAASATAATWNSGPTASAHLNSTHLNSSTQLSESGARLTVTDQLVAPQAEVAYQQTSAQQTSATLAQRAYQLRAAQARYATAKWTAARKQAQAQQPQAQQAQAQQPAKQAQATASTVTVTAPSGSPQQIAEAMLGSFGWSSSQFACLDPLWAHESGWSVSAYNAGSGAFGIPQALPGSRMASAGPDWQTDAATQIKWGLEYIKDTYGSPCGAYDHEEATGWY